MGNYCSTCGVKVDSGNYCERCYQRQFPCCKYCRSPIQANQQVINNLHKYPCYSLQTGRCCECFGVVNRFLGQGIYCTECYDVINRPPLRGKVRHQRADRSYYARDDRDLDVHTSMTTHSMGKSPIECMITESPGKQQISMGTMQGGVDKKLISSTPPDTRGISLSEVISVPEQPLLGDSDGTERGADKEIGKGDDGDVKATGVVNHEGGTVVAPDFQLECPLGALEQSDGPLDIKITLEKPAKHYDMLVKNGLENDVIFIAPIINLQPNGQTFKKPVMVSTKFTIEKNTVRNILILHGTRTGGGKIVWEDITHKSKIDLEKKELKVQINHFSRIAVLVRMLSLTTILAKDILSRVNWLGFHYTLSVLFKDNHPLTPLAELALVFMSRDIYHEQCYREHSSSVLMQLKGQGFRELCSIENPGSNRIYNNESLKVSVLLGQDYKLADGQLESNDLIVDSSAWWSTGHAIKLPLKGVDGARILSGKISVEGQQGHTLKETFCELDHCDYMRRLLRVEGSIFNLVPISQKLDVPEGVINKMVKSWQNEDEQLKVITQHCSKGEDNKEDPAVLRETLQVLSPEDYQVSERGKMHINHLRELAFKIQGLKHENPYMKEYFTDQIKSLCSFILRDCCIEVDAEASIENHSRFLHFHRRVSEDVAQALERICSPSATFVNEDFFSVVPFFIQAIKEIFHKENPSNVQNGLKGLTEDIIHQHEANVRDALKDEDILGLLIEVSSILENLCLDNCSSQSTEEIKNWGESVAFWIMLKPLKRFFQSHQDSKLLKRLQLFSRSLKKIYSDIRNHDVKEIDVRYFYDVSLNLIKFAKFDPSNLVRFELTDTNNSRVICYNETIKYDRPRDTFSQHFELRRESEDELQLGAIAHVHLGGGVCKVGAFISMITLPLSSEEELARCSVTALPVAIKRERTDSGKLRVFLYSTHRKNISEALSLLQRELDGEMVDSGQVEIKESPLRVRCLVEAGRVVRLRLVYKWHSEAISVESKDFVAIADSLAEGACSSDVQIAASSSSLETELATLSVASSPTAENGNFVLDPSTKSWLCPLLPRVKEIHFHQTQHHVSQQGHYCLAGDKTNITETASNDQRFLQVGLTAPSQLSLTEGPTSDEPASF